MIMHDLDTVVLALSCCHGNPLSPIGAHSHIRGLGLDDALEPRPVSSLLVQSVGGVGLS